MNEIAIRAVSPITKDLLEITKKSALTNSPVLLTGELGTGKKTFAKIIYKNCNSNDLPFFCYECRSESSINLKNASLENGALYFENVECLPKNLQEQLLNIIKDKVNAKIIAGTTENLSVFVQNGKFLEELFFRLNVLPIRIPSLRLRKEDIVPIAEDFVNFFNFKYKKNVQSFSDAAKQLLLTYYWPGNILELKSVISRSVLVCKDSVIQASDLHISTENPQVENLEFSFEEEDKNLKTALNDFKRRYVIKILDECGWNQTKAGKILGIQRTYVSRLLNELHIRDKNE